jgi:hypothetical protein
MGRIDRGSDCYSQHLDPLLRVRTERFGCGRTVMKTFVGRIVTVPDGAGRNVTVSKWGVA